MHKILLTSFNFQGGFLFDLSWTVLSCVIKKSHCNLFLFLKDQVDGGKGSGVVQQQTGQASKDVELGICCGRITAAWLCSQLCCHGRSCQSISSRSHGRSSLGAALRLSPRLESTATSRCVSPLLLLIEFRVWSQPGKLQFGSGAAAANSGTGGTSTESGNTSSGTSSNQQHQAQQHQTPTSDCPATSTSSTSASNHHFTNYTNSMWMRNGASKMDSMMGMAGMGWPTSSMGMASLPPEYNR